MPGNLTTTELNAAIDSGEIDNVFSISGQGGSVNTGFMVLTLAPWDGRVRTQQQIAADITRAVSLGRRGL